MSFALWYFSRLNLRLVEKCVTMNVIVVSGGDRVRRLLKGGLAVLFVSLLLLGFLMVHTITEMQSYGRLINYVGIVRGATQRLVKLELEGSQSDDLITYLEDILVELSGGGGTYGLPNLDDPAYQRDLETLNSMWSQVKEHIYMYRSGAEEKGPLLALSETYFVQANNTVFSADAYTSGQTSSLLLMCSVMLGAMLLTWIFIFWAGGKKMLFLESTNQKLSDLTRRDPLTGVYKLDAFKEAAQQCLDREDQRKYAVVYTDFADFNYINDVFSYAYGDRILAKYGDILQTSLREGEVCGRVSADNFVLLLYYDQPEEIAARQRRADRAITTFMLESSSHQTLPTCCGICCVEDVVEDLRIDGLMDRARFARKTVKDKTNPNYVYYNETIRNKLREAKKIESRMLTALEQGEFVVYYQPKVDLRTGKIACSEALVRWRLDSGTIIGPDRFIPVFEEKLIIDRLDQYVFEQVCSWLREQIDADRPVLPVSVNVSRLQFYDQDFVPRYIELREKYQIPPELLEVEFTESIVFDNSDLLVKTVNSLKKAGFSCSIDDFGKGYSSLSLLKLLPVDVLKLDRFFFEAGSDQERDWAIVQGIIELVHKFHIHAVAEGIEDQGQVERLRAMGCDLVQGYVFYRPMPQQEFEQALLKQQGG